MKSIDKSKTRQVRQFESNEVIQTDLEFTFESNRLEGNTLTCRKTSYNQGLTITGKTMKEHLEVINQIEAITM
jgi:Fic family protein